MKQLMCFIVMLVLIGFTSLAGAGGWQDDDMSLSGSKSEGSWQTGIHFNFATRGVDSVGGFVSDDPAGGGNVYLWYKPLGLYVDASKSNSLNSEKDFGDSQSYQIGLYREMLEDFYVDLGYAYHDLWDFDRGLNTDFHSVYGGLYLPRIGVTSWCDGFRLYAETQDFWPSDSSVMTMGGGLEYKVGVKTKLLFFQDLMPNGLDIDLSGGGNNGVFGRQSDAFGFAMLRVSTRYDLGKNFSVEPYAIGVTQSRPAGEEKESIGTAGLSARFDLF